MRILSGILLAAVSAVPVAAQDAPLEQPDVERVYTPIPAERLEEMVPKHPGYLGALAPANLNADRAPAPINITGTWFVDLSEGFAHYMFGPPYPRFGPEGVEALIESARAEEEGRRYRNSVGDCYPLGMPMIMTRVWPHAFIQLPTAIYMISGFNNSVRTIFIDGRDFTDPDIVVPSYNGESVGHWEGDTLVVETRYFETDHHWIDSGIPISEATTPQLYMLMRRTLADVGLASYSAKNAYQRVRPFMVNGEPTCTPEEEGMLRKDGSYPSGHTSIGWGWALILAELMPEKAEAILARGRAFGESRNVCNVHWHSDVVAGRMVAASAYSQLHNNEDFLAAMGATRKELAGLDMAALSPSRDCEEEAKALSITTLGK